MKTRSIRHRKGAKPALSSIGLAVVATMIASGAQATTGNDVVDINTAQSGSIATHLTGSNVVINVSGAQTNTSNTTTANTLGAEAFGNKAAAPSVINLAVMSGSNAVINTVNTDTGSVTANATNNTVAIGLSSFQSGAVVNSDNSISATTTVNLANSTIAGVVPTGLPSNQQNGYADQYNYYGSQYQSENANLVVSTQQQASSQQSGATASGNKIDISLSADNGIISASPVLTGNTIAATFKDNSSSNIIDIQAGGTPVYAGSAVVVNDQTVSNSFPNTATNASSLIDTDVAGSSSLHGRVTVTGNAITGAATGNEALANKIVLGDGVSLQGYSYGYASAYSSSPSYDQGYANGDLLVSNNQSNNSDSIVSTVSAAGIGATIHKLGSGGSVLVESNAVTSAATGNVALNSIANGAAAASFTGSASLLNNQQNSYATISATTGNSTIGAAAGLNSSVPSLGVRSATMAPPTAASSAWTQIAWRQLQ